MNCRKVQKLLSLAADGRLDESQRAAVQRHVEACDACRRYQTRLAQLEQAFHGLTVMEPRPGFAARTLARLPENAAQTGRFGRLAELLQPTPMAMSAASLALGILLAATMNGTQSTTGAENDEQLVLAELFDATPAESVSGQYLQLLGFTEEQ